MRRQAILIIFVILCISLFMAVVQFFASEYGGAGGAATGWKELGYIRFANALTAISKWGWLRWLDDFWQYHVNWPRNQLLYRFGEIASPYDIGVWSRSDRTGLWDPVRGSIVLVLGTVVVYGPLLIGLHWLIHPLRRRSAVSS